MRVVDRVVDRFRRIRSIVADSAMGVGILAIGIIEMVLAGGLSASQRAGALAILATESMGVTLRRANLGVAYALVLLAALGGGFWPNGYNSTWLPELILLYTVSERSGAVVSALALVATFAMRFPPNGGFHLSTVPFLIQIDFLYAILAWFAGRAQARRRAIACDLERTAALVQEEQEQLARSAIGIERARIIGELHTLVVRGVEQMNADTREARRYLVGEAGRASQSIGAIEETGRAALVAMRRLLVVLRTRDHAATPSSPDAAWRNEESARSSSVAGGLSGPSLSMVRAWSHAADLAERARRWMPTPWVTDLLVVLAMVTLAVAEPFSDGADFMHRPVDVLLAAIVVSALLFRRRHPLVVLAFIASVIFVSTAFLTSETTTADHTLFIAVYTVASLRGPRWGAAAIGAEVVAYAPLVTSYFAHTSSVSNGISIAVGWDALFVFAVLSGIAVRESRRVTAELRDQSDLLRQTREERIRRAVNEDRSRIARDVHDMVAHGMTLMVIQAGAARWLLERDLARADRALQSVERAGQQALCELQSLVGSLGGASLEGIDLLPLDDRHTIRSLVDDAVQAGMQVELIIDGESRELDAGLEISLYRIVQEALTNVRKHASGARAWVELRFTPHGVDVQVTSGHSSERGVPQAIPGAAQGLIGIAERAALFGGRAQFGPTPEGGFRVGASLLQESVRV